jgi:ATP-dependent DNA helicase UvrD/PcrA
MIHLNPEQQKAVDYDDDVVITACPGSGKTRVLTARVIRGVMELKSPKERVVALTFTNRAADEIQARLDQENVPSDRLWAGTIHSFALEWVLRPYAPYCDVIRRGFSVADEFHTERLLSQLKRDNRLPDYTQVSTGYDRNGNSLNTEDDICRISDLYKAQLHDTKLIDYDDVLYLAYRLLADHTEVGETLASIFRLICVDEVQDVQDLQFGILSLIAKAARTPIRLFFVGDENQSIYDSLGAITKSPEEIACEFASENLGHLELQGNYRSTQRVINLYTQFRPDVPPITSYAKYADQEGVITFDDQTVAKVSVRSWPPYKASRNSEDSL